MNIDRFRFRMWNHSSETMYYDLDDLFPALSPIYYQDNLQSSLILMQCTGLRDVEGTLIWEFDIIQRFNEVNPDYGFDVCVVQWNQSRCYFELQGQKEYYGHICGNHAIDGRYKVVGNQFEHPHLIAQPGREG